MDPSLNARYIDNLPFALHAFLSAEGAVVGLEANDASQGFEEAHSRGASLAPQCNRQGRSSLAHALDPSPRDGALRH